jgi:hypothetical protein
LLAMSAKSMSATKRRYLRQVRARDKGIVYALRKRGIARSSDLHEWCNDLSAVSTRDSAKLWCQ